MSEAELSKMTAQPIEVELGGKKFKVSALNIDDLAGLEMWIKQERIAAYLKASKQVAVDPLTHSKTLVALSSQPISNEEVQTETSTLRGIRFVLWRMIQRYAPKVKLEKMGEFVDINNLTEATDIVAAHGGLEVETEDESSDPPQAGPAEASAEK